jgi:hypothetical protein
LHCFIISCGFGRFSNTPLAPLRLRLVVEEELSNINIEALVHSDLVKAEVTDLFTEHFPSIATVFGFYAGAGHGVHDLSCMSLEEFFHFVQSAAVLNGGVLRHRQRLKHIFEWAHAVHPSKRAHGVGGDAKKRMKTEGKARASSSDAKGGSASEIHSGDKSDSGNASNGKGHIQHLPEEHLFRSEFLQALLLLALEVELAERGGNQGKKTPLASIDHDMGKLLRAFMEEKLEPHAVQIEQQHLHSDELRNGMSDVDTQAMVARHYNELLFVYKHYAMGEFSQEPHRHNHGGRPTMSFTELRDLLVHSGLLNLQRVSECAWKTVRNMVSSEVIEQEEEVGEEIHPPSRRISPRSSPPNMRAVGRSASFLRAETRMQATKDQIESLAMRPKHKTQFMNAMSTDETGVGKDGLGKNGRLTGGGKLAVGVKEGKGGETSGTRQSATSSQKSPGRSAGKLSTADRRQMSLETPKMKGVPPRTAGSRIVVQQTLTSKDARIAFVEAQRTFEEPHEELVFSEFIECLARVSVAKWSGEGMSFHQKLKVAVGAIIGLAPVIRSEVQALKQDKRRREDGGAYSLYVPPTHSLVQLTELLAVSEDTAAKADRRKLVDARLHGGDMKAIELQAQLEPKTHSVYGTKFKHKMGFLQSKAQMKKRLNR